MKRLLFSTLLLGSSVVFAGEPVSVNPPTVTSAPTSLNQSLPQALLQTGPAVSVQPTMTSSPTWAPTATACATPTYLNCNQPTCNARSCEPKYTAMPGCSPGPSLTRPYVNLLQPPGWLNHCDDGSCHRGNLLERLGAWLSFSRSAQDAPGFTARPFQAPLRTYFPCQPNAGSITCGTSGPVEGGRLRTLYIPLVNRCDAMPGRTADGVQTTIRPNLLQRMLGFFTPEGFGFSSRGTGSSHQGSCADGSCNALGSNCTTGRVRYANPMTHAVTNTPNIGPGQSPPSTYPGTLVPVNPVSTATPGIMPSSYMKPLKVTPATQPLTNP